MAKKIINYYKVLKVEKDADTETIKRKCKRGLKRYDKENHPRKNKIYCNAYKILTDDEKRAKYDKVLEAQEEKEEKEYENITENFGRKRMKGHGKKGKGMGRSRRKNSNFENPLNFAKDLEKEYGIVSKVFKGVLGTAKSQPLMTGANLLLGGAMAGAGVKKGRNIMSKRKR